MSNETNNTLLLNKNSALISIHVLLCRSICEKKPFHKSSECEENGDLFA